ncbi:MAG: hypothetical protein KUL77_01360 [Thermomonas sp.]|uniref:hypothetical protein n=1 Tax=Thermomonas sp. TaxID=1971895 RepID=UPI001ED19D0A|nr:hypothetical protein [Thermomonas sp.]MBV2208198.1 hypothetical protein [Thermomonas sp.]
MTTLRTRIERLEANRERGQAVPSIILIASQGVEPVGIMRGDGLRLGRLPGESMDALLKRAEALSVGPCELWSEVRE